MHVPSSLQRVINVKNVLIAALLWVATLLPGWAQLPGRGFSVANIVEQRDRKTARQQGEEALNAGDVPSAVRQLERWVEAVPTDYDGALLLAKAYGRAGRVADSSLAARLAANIGKPDQFPAVYMPQRRYGRYRIHYPNGYSPLRRYRLVVLLHGNGNTSELMLNWGKTLGLDNCILVAPDAPYLKVRESFASFKERFSAAGDGNGMPDTMSADVITLSAEWYHDVVKDARQRLNVSLDKPLLVGFSQGGFYAHVMATRFPETFVGIVSVCGSMYPEGRVIERYDRLRTFGIDVMVAHGRLDDVVPFQTAQLIVGALETAKVNTVFVPFDGKHWPTAEANSAIRQWIVERTKP